MLIGLLLLVRNWSRKRLAAAAGVNRSAISRYERGVLKAQRRTLERLAAATGIPLSAVEALLPALRRLRSLTEDRSAPRARGAAVSIPRSVGVAVETVLAQELPIIQAAAPPVSVKHQAPASQDRPRAEEMWRRLKLRPASARLALVEEASEYQSWALVEKICEESERVAADRPEEALELADLALRTAQAVPGEPGWRSLVEGYAWAHVGNARRVASDLPGAAEAHRTARQLWDEGAPADPGLLDGSRLLDLEASLLRAQRKMSEALERLDQALALHPADERAGRILLKKGFTLEQMGDYAGAIESLTQAEHWIDGSREPLWLLSLRFNLLVNLCHAGRYREAEAGLPELRALIEQHGQNVSLLRLRWLEGRIAAGLGRRAEAIQALAEVREKFAAQEIRYDEALVSMELANLYLEEGRTADVRALVRKVVSIFREQGIPDEERKALDLFRRAL